MNLDQKLAAIQGQLDAVMGKILSYQDPVAAMARPGSTMIGDIGEMADPLGINRELAPRLAYEAWAKTLGRGVVQGPKKLEQWRTMRELASPSLGQQMETVRMTRSVQNRIREQTADVRRSLDIHREREIERQKENARKFR